MKVLRNLTIAAAGAFMLASCCNSGMKCPVEGISTSQYDSASYAMGVSLGSMMKNSNVTAVNFAEFNRGIKDVFEGRDTAISEQKIMMAVSSYIEKVVSLKSEEAKKKEKAFFEKNKSNEGVIETESGLQYKVVTEGTGAAPAVKDTVEVKYVGKLVDGKVFDESKGETVKFTLDRVIAGWRQGLQLMKEGGKYELWIPAELGYGSVQMGPNLPANSTLHFEVELVKVYPAPAEPAEKE